MDSKRKALIISGAASEKKALDIVTIDMRKMSGISDYFVIASGRSTTHTKAVADNIVKRLKENGVRLGHMEGADYASWILLDYGGVVGHVFLEDTRRFYDLERLWGDAPQSRYRERKPKRRLPAKRAGRMRRRADRRRKR